jgi:hypothetical protein
MADNKKRCIYFHPSTDEGREIEAKLEEAEEAIEGNGYKLITIFSSEGPELHIEGNVYSLKDHWIDVFILYCKEQLIAKKQMTLSS